MIRVAINGFGRIGRNFFRAFLENSLYQSSFEIVAINLGKADADRAAYLFKYDSILGVYPGVVTVKDSILMVDTIKISLLFSEIIQEHMWSLHDIDWVVDCSGCFTDGFVARLHQTKGGARKVLISAPAVNEDITIVMGVNEALYNDQHHTIISLASCTTNAAVPILSLLDKKYNIVQGSLKTVHAYTNSQVLLDTDVGDMRRSRSAVINIIPTTSGMFSSIVKVLPHLKNKLHGLAVRVPVCNVSFVDILVQVKAAPTAVDFINQLFESSADYCPYQIIGYEAAELVSSDFLKNDHSVVVDAALTQLNNDWINVFGWYDNEWAYSRRLCDFIRLISLK